MDWANESYVRVYTRETDDDLALSWDARSVWRALLTKFDRSGLIETRRGAVGLAAIARVPIDVMERALPELVADGRVRHINAGYFAPNFMVAQETPRSDKARQHDSRAKRRARNLVEAPDVSHDVTLTSTDPRLDSAELSLGESHPPELLGSEKEDPGESVLAAERRPPPGIPMPGSRDRTVKLNGDAWQYAAQEHVRLMCEHNLAGSNAWPGLPVGEAKNDLVERTRELLDMCGGDHVAAAAKHKHRVDVAVAEAIRERHLRWLTPMKLFDSEQFWRALEIDPIDAARPRPVRGAKPEEEIVKGRFKPL